MGLSHMAESTFVQIFLPGAHRAVHGIHNEDRLLFIPGMNVQAGKIVVTNY